MISKNINILLADDDKDDCLFFKEALEETELQTQLTTVQDGEQLMQLLTNKVITKDFSAMPHVLFLNLNMPRKNGFACLEEIKHSEKLISLPVIIFSTAHDQRVAELLYNNGAKHYICKPAYFSEFKKVIQQALTLVSEKKFANSQREFLLLNN